MNGWGIVLLRGKVRAVFVRRKGKMAPALSSPVEERHIDFLLEEEFASNPRFLKFFIECARSSGQTFDSRSPVDAHETSNCQVVRSVTTSDGETDVLVTYSGIGSNESRIALLIENKIGAQFQSNQALRYIQRGNEDCGKSWDSFWTCLVAPRAYAKGLAGFDTRVDIEDIITFFQEDDQRTAFKRKTFQAILDRAINKAQTDPFMTAFRSVYASLAQDRFLGTSILPEGPRDAWADDSWFNFASPQLPEGVKIIHKPKAGVVHLTFPHAKAADLLRPPHWTQEQKIDVIERPGSASFEVPVPKIAFFELREAIGQEILPAATVHALQLAFDAVQLLASFRT
jgi:hypothetical protein